MPPRWALGTQPSLGDASERRVAGRRAAAAPSVFAERQPAPVAGIPEPAPKTPPPAAESQAQSATVLSPASQEGAVQTALALGERVEELTLENERLRERLAQAQRRQVAALAPSSAPPASAPARTGLAVTPLEVVEDIIDGQPFYLGSFRSVQAKRRLLRAAVETGHSDAIVTVVDFLRQSMAKASLELVFQGRDLATAVSVYSLYLRRQRDYVSLAAFHRQMKDRAGEGLALLEYSFFQEGVEERLQTMRRCLPILEREPSLARYFADAKTQVALLQRQLDIDRRDGPVAQEGHVAVFRNVKRPVATSLSLTQLLEYLLIYHLDKIKAKDILGAQDLRKTFKMTDKQWAWAFLRARAKLADFDSLKQITPASVFGSKPTSVIGFAPFVEVCRKNHAPRDRLVAYCRLIEPADRRFHVAREFRLYEVSIEALVSQKNVEGLRLLREELNMEMGLSASERFRQAIDRALQNLIA